MYYFIQIFLFINNKEIFTYYFNNFNFTIPIVLHKTDYFLTKKARPTGLALIYVLYEFYSSSLTASSSTSLFCTSPGTSSYVEGDIMNEARPPVSELNVVE